MAKRKSDSPQKAALREMMSNYLKENDVHIKDGSDVNSIMRDMMSIILEGTLDAEMDEELGYSKYDYRNKDTENSRNGYSKKTMHTSYGDMDINVPRDRKGEFEPQVVKKYQNTVTQDMEEKIRKEKIHVLVFCSPHNPCGRVWEQTELEKLDRFFRSRWFSALCGLDAETLLARLKEEKKRNGYPIVSETGPVS